MKTTRINFTTDYTDYTDGKGISTQRRKDCKDALRPTVTEGIEPRIAQITRMGDFCRKKAQEAQIGISPFEPFAPFRGHSRNPQSAIRNCSGLTVIEMLVSTTLLAMIVIGLTAMFVETQRAFKTGIRQSSTADAGHTVIDMVGTDLSQASDAQTAWITNLYWGWWTSNYTYNYQDRTNNVYRTNQLQEIFVLVHTNTQWMGIGYAVSNWAPGVGTLYRYLVSTNAPLLDNSLFEEFHAAVGTQHFGPHFDRVADGVVHLKIRAYDLAGEFGEVEYPEGEDYAYANQFYEFGYPFPGKTNSLGMVAPPAGLPNSVQLEVGVLESEVFEQLRALPAGSAAQKAFFGRNGGHIQIFRQNIPIAAAPR